MLDKDGSQVSQVCFISRARGESIQLGQFDTCSSFGNIGVIGYLGNGVSWLISANRASGVR